MKQIHHHSPDSRQAPEDLLFPGEESEASRREFLRLAGFGIVGVGLSGCSRGPERLVVPTLSAEESVVAGRTYWIASSCAGCAARCGTLVKCRDGRPIKVEGNALHAPTRGGLCAVGQAQVLSLYDSKRSARPTDDGRQTNWESVLATLRGELTRAKRVRILTGTLASPSTEDLIARLAERFSDVRHVQYDPLSCSAILDAHEATHGRRALPAYRFDRAEMIAAFDADFLGTWIAPVQFASDYAAGRQPDGRGSSMSRHVQFESRMSLTGAAADRRVLLSPSEIRPALAGLCAELDRLAGQPGTFTGSLEHAPQADSIAQVAEALWDHAGRALVVCGVNDDATQRLVNHANHRLGSYGHTLTLARASRQRLGDDRGLHALQRELLAGHVDLLVVSGVNPAYDAPPGFAATLSRAGRLVVHSDGLDETAAIANTTLPALHTLESWDDTEIAVGRYTFTQPTIPALVQGRSLRGLLAGLLGDTRDDHAILLDYWKRRAVEGRAAGLDPTDFEAGFDRFLRDGYAEESALHEAEPLYIDGSVGAPISVEAGSGLRLVLYPKIGLTDGAHAHNPWLQELPDPISKIVWDNYACVAEGLAAELGLQEGDLVRLDVRGEKESVTLPVHLQRGQHERVVAVALGYGRLGTDRFAGVAPAWVEGAPTVRPGETIGKNAARWIELLEENLRYDTRTVELVPTGERVVLASTQDHHSLSVPEHLAPRGGEVRQVLLTVDYESYRHDPAHALPHGHHAEADLWPADHQPSRRHWGMAIDLAACTGCSACTISCQAENNVPVVGRDEVARHREMSWLRIDRYFAGEGADTTAAYQPMLCQQCDNAPCESVCPVLATVHSSEGLNQQVYNRCVGTRYCANTCPYKVRRFNWFDYPHEDELANQVLNPDVTVRTRGVMEKCSFCYQRIQEAKSEAAAAGAVLMDGDIQVACQQSCPTRAIVFGDMNDPESMVARRMASGRAYGVLTELNVKPSVRYLARVRNAAGPVLDGDSEQEVQHG